MFCSEYRKTNIASLFALLCFFSIAQVTDGFNLTCAGDVVGLGATATLHCEYAQASMEHLVLLLYWRKRYGNGDVMNYLPSKNTTHIDDQWKGRIKQLTMLNATSVATTVAISNVTTTDEGEYICYILLKNMAHASGVATVKIGEPTVLTQTAQGSPWAEYQVQNASEPDGTSNKIKHGLNISLIVTLTLSVFTLGGVIGCGGFLIWRFRNNCRNWFNGPSEERNATDDDTQAQKQLTPASREVNIESVEYSPRTSEKSVTFIQKSYAYLTKRRFGLRRNPRNLS